jgi:hypothetical protein
MNRLGESADQSRAGIRPGAVKRALEGQRCYCGRTAVVLIETHSRSTNTNVFYCAQHEPDREAAQRSRTLAYLDDLVREGEAAWRLERGRQMAALDKISPRKAPPSTATGRTKSTTKRSY